MDVSTDHTEPCGIPQPGAIKTYTLLGPSVCGKATTLRWLRGSKNPTSARWKSRVAWWFATNRRIHGSPELRDVGMVFQSYVIWSHRTVFENVEFPLKVRRANRREIKERVEEALESRRSG